MILVLQEFERTVWTIGWFFQDDVAKIVGIPGISDGLPISGPDAMKTTFQDPFLT